METPPDQDQSLPIPPASLPTLVCEYPLPRSSSPELPNLTHFTSQSSAFHSPASFNVIPPTSSPIQPASMIGGSEEFKTAPSPNLSTLSHDSEGTACSMCSSALASTSSPSSSPNLDCSSSVPIAMSSTQTDPLSGSQGDTESEQTEVALHENSLSASDGSSSPLLPSPSLLDFHFPSSLTSPPIIESPSQCPEDNEKDFLFPDSDGVGLSDPPTKTQKEEEETHSSLSFRLDKEDPCPHDDNTDPAPASPVQDVIHVKMDHLSLDLEDTLQRNEKGEGEDERHTYTVQTQKSVYISDTESSAGLSKGSRLVSQEVCYETEIGPQFPSCSLHDELSAETKQEEFSKVFQVETDGTESYLVLHDKAREAHSRTEVKTSDLIEIESLDLVFETSVDGSEGEYGDVDAFFQQLDTEWRVFWAEPIQAFSTTPVLGESGSLESSDGYPGNTLLPRVSAALDSFSSTGKAMTLSSSSSSSSTTMDSGQASLTNAASLTTQTVSSDTTLALAQFTSFSKTPNLKPSSRSVSVQMSSSPSSHIVHRKDVPYVTDSKRTLPPSVLPLDTSTPFRAVQSWTDLQIQRNTLTKKLSHGVLNTFPNEVTVSMSASEMTQRPTVIFSSSPSFPLLSKDWQSHDCLPGLARNYQNVSESLDKEVDKNGNEDEKRLWEANQTATVACCCSCDHQCTCCTQNSYTTQHTLGNIPVSNKYTSLCSCI